MNTKSDGTLRSIARELGMVSSAIYRYVDSRDDLLTRLIIEAYDPLGSAAEAAVAASTGQPDAERWVATALAIRDWARGRPHEYMLLYGTPVPGYAAPDDTVAPGTRVTLALLSIVRDAATGGRLSAPPLVVDAPTRLTDDLERLAGVVELPVPSSVLLTPRCSQRSRASARCRSASARRMRELLARIVRKKFTHSSGAA